MRLAGLFLSAALLLGCDDGGSSLYILPFSTAGVRINPLPLTVGQTDTLKLKLSGNVSDITYVDLAADFAAYKTYVEINPETIKFKSGEGKDGADVSFKGLKSTTSMGGVTARFELRGTNEFRELKIEVSDQIIPDAGPMPDVGVPPDTGVTPDVGATPDVGSAPDTGSTDA